MDNSLLDQIIPGDCLSILPQIPEASVDVVFADPPYNLQLTHELHRPNQTKVDAVDDAWDKFESFAEYDRFTHAWLSGCREVLKETGTLWVIGSYHNIYRIGKILQDLDFWILNDVVWIKDNPMPNFRGVRFTNAHETMIWAQKRKGSRYTFNHNSMKALNEDLQMRSDWYLPLCTGRERRRINGEKAHTTQKPEGLLYRILLASTNPGDLVLDPFFGTGTTGAVAKKLDRHFIGIEQDPAYIQVARERIASITPAPGETLEIAEPRYRSRIPFGALIEAGLIQPGQVLTFAPDPSVKATVMANAQLLCNGNRGSIHAIAKSLLQDAPANGWELWLFEEDQGMASIDNLRNQLHEIKRNNGGGRP